MKYKAFISYANADKDLVESLADHLSRSGVKAWVYSLDRTLAADTWSDIEAQIRECDIMIFVISNHTPSAKGQDKELQLAVEKLEAVTGQGRILPIVISGTSFSSLPENLKFKNGLELDAHTVRSTALKIARQAFPTMTEDEAGRSWKHPIPGEWLEVFELNSSIEEYFEIGDPLYFRQISPIGLFECYAPKLGQLYWVYPENTRTTINPDQYREVENEIPFIFRVSGMEEIAQSGWELWHNKKGGGK